MLIPIWQFGAMRILHCSIRKGNISFQFYSKQFYSRTEATPVFWSVPKFCPTNVPQWLSTFIERKHKAQNFSIFISCSTPSILFFPFLVREVGNELGKAGKGDLKFQVKRDWKWKQFPKKRNIFSSAWFLFNQNFIKISVYVFMLYLCICFAELYI